MTTIIGTSGDDNLKGGNGADTLMGGAGDDFLQGKGGNDYIDGGSGDDQIQGNEGDDYLIGGQGNDFIHGGTGIDTARYYGSILEYSFSRNGENLYVSHTGGSHIDGNDRLLQVEKLQFADALIDLTKNNAPIAFDDSASTDEDVGTYSGSSVLANDFDWEHDSLSATPGTFTGVYGTLVLSSNGTYTYTPYASNQALDDGESVQDSFTYSVSDGSLSDTGTLTITIAGKNDAPVANDDTASTSEDSSVSGNVLANDTDVDVEPLTVANPGTYVGTYGTLTLAANGSYTYTPNAAAQGLDDGETRQDVFTYNASDGTATDGATLTVTVNGANDAPVANDDTASTSEDSSVSGNVLTNDTDVDVEPLTVANPGTYVGAYGTLVLAANGSYTYTPNAAAQGLDVGESAQDVFTYNASDGTATDGATLTVTINGANDAPDANDDTASTSEDSSVSGNVLANDTDVDVEPLTVANPGTYVGTYGTLVLAANGSYTYTPGAAAQALDVGESAQDVFAYTASDGTDSDAATLTVTINGANDAPVANDDAASTSEDSAVSGNVLANDTDVDVEPLTVANPGTYVGAYGTLVLAADGSYTYTPGAAAQGLNVGQSAQDVFTYAASDGTASDAATLTVTINGANDAPTANPDTASTTENAAVSIAVLANDADPDNGAVLTVTGASGPAGKGSVSVVANQVVFDPGSDFDHLAQGAIEQVVLTYAIQDEHGATSSSTVTVTVTGTNDAPVAHPDVASGTENQVLAIDALANDTDIDDGATKTLVAASAPVGKGTASIVGGQVQFNPGTSFDHLAAGASEVVVLSYTMQDEHGATSSSTISVTVSGTNDSPIANADTATTTENASVTVDVLANDTDADDGAALSVVSASAPAGQGSASVVGNQVQFAPGSDFDHLAVGESANVVVGYTMQDEHGATSSSTVTVTVTGTNDSPTIVAGGTTASGSVTELPDGDPGENSTIHQAGGTVAFNDIDLSDTHSATATAQGAGYYGTFTLDPVNQAGDTVAWHFNVSDSAIDGLNAGEVITQTYTVQVSDGHGGTASQDVTITITGAADVQGPDGTNWYIDNSAVGSTNVGSQANPFTSIAAFNAAQGTADGPGVGDNVFLLAGTGTYTEADGINLLDGQVLTGVASGALRPTIVTTGVQVSGAGQDGVDVAQNNHLSGFDIGSTTGAGISDSGGSVGSLLVTDVAKSGGGQIADFDQGGTLNVTLTSAASTGSTGGAIDLAGVGGSFSVAGAVTIGGVQTGGGVDVTGSSVAVSLAGGGSISTGSADAVNFVGNTGSLVIGGGMALVTTSGIGLDASGGGTVSATGSGNTIVSAGAPALNVSGTTIGASDLTFQSISAAGDTNGIVLQNTGSLGGLTITGTGVAGSGGTIAGTSGAGIVATNTQDLNLASMVISNTGGAGILATDLRGASTVMGSTIGGFGSGGGNVQNGITVVNTNTNMDSLTLANSTVTNGATGNDGLFFEARGSSNMTLRVTGSTFSGLFGDGVQVNGTPTSTGTVNASVIDSDFLNAAPSGNGGVLLVSLNSMTLNALVEGNTFDNLMRLSSNSAPIAATSGGTANANITIQDNVIDHVVNARGITFTADGGTTHLKIDGNSIDHLASNSKIGVNVNLTNTAVADVIVTDNHIGQNGNLWSSGNGSTNALLLQTQNSATMTSLVNGNLITGNTSVELVRVRAINTSTLGATVTGNTLTDTLTTHVEFDASTGTGAAAGGTINLNMSGNTLPAGGIGILRLAEGPAPGDINVVQASSAALSAANNNATITVTGSPDFGQPAPGLPSNPTLPPDPLMALSVAGERAGEILTEGQLGSVVELAIQSWIAGGATDEQVAAMRGAEISVAQLSGIDLGLTSGDRVVIDSDGAGFGWSFGSGPGMDLLSVVMHELGHVAGFGDSYRSSAAGEVMYGYLGLGEARGGDLLPSGAELFGTAGGDLLAGAFEPHAPAFDATFSATGEPMVDPVFYP